MKLHGHDPVSFDDVKNEIFDMVKPEDPLAITLQDLIQWYANFLFEASGFIWFALSSVVVRFLFSNKVTFFAA